MAIPSKEYARMLADINVPRGGHRSSSRGLHASQAHRHHPPHECAGDDDGAGEDARPTYAGQSSACYELAGSTRLCWPADAAEAALRGFAEIETTVRVARFAPFNALAILIGAQTGRGGVLTQCSVEEALGLRLAMKGLTSYAETLSVYGTEMTFVDGDDTPWSKAFLASAYASRGVKIRFTSGTGSEALMGRAEKKSMLYLEARCLLVVKGAGSQGVQNGSISCIALPEALPGGVRAVLAENLLACHAGLWKWRLATTLWHRIPASARPPSSCRNSSPAPTSFFPVIAPYPNATTCSAAAISMPKTSTTTMCCSAICRLTAASSLSARTRRLTSAAKQPEAIQAVYRELDFPVITDDEVAAATVAHSSDDMPERDILPDLEAADRFMASDCDFVAVMQALQRSGFKSRSPTRSWKWDGSASRPTICNRRLSSMPTSKCRAPSTTPTTIQVPAAATAPRDSAGREMQAIPQAQPPTGFVEPHVGEPLSRLVEIGPAARGTGKEVVLALGPAFGRALGKTIGGLEHEEVLKAILGGIAGEGGLARIIRVYHSSDCAAIGFVGARLSGSGIAIGLQSRGTAVIHQKDLAPLNNLELFPQSPSLTLATYANIGVNAARYALGRSTVPVSVKIDNGARLRLIVKTALLHRRETDEVCPDQAPVECLFDWEPD